MCGLRDPQKEAWVKLTLLYRNPRIRKKKLKKINKFSSRGFEWAKLTEQVKQFIKKKKHNDNTICVGSTHEK